VLGDAARLAQVVENLLANAAKYTDARRHDLAFSGSDGRRHRRAERPRHRDRQSIPTLLGHIFDLFTQAPAGLDRAKGGLGLGLALVRSLVELHGGSVEAFSAGAGKGTEVVVTLPRLHAGRRPRRGAEATPSAPLAARRILVVDDETDAADALVELLELEGAHRAGGSRTENWRCRSLATFEPELVLLDLGLPRIDGYEVARRLRDRLGPAGADRRPDRLPGRTGAPARSRLRRASAEAHVDREAARPGGGARRSLTRRDAEAGGQGWSCL
jgi:CheY-like chemotaxis protein